MIRHPAGSHSGRQRQDVDDRQEMPDARRKIFRLSVRHDALEIIEQVKRQRVARHLRQEPRRPGDDQIPPTLLHLGRLRRGNDGLARSCRQQRGHTDEYGRRHNRQPFRLRQQTHTDKCRRNAGRNRHRGGEQSSCHALLRVRHFVGHDRKKRGEHGVHRHLEQRYREDDRCRRRRSGDSGIGQDGRDQPEAQPPSPALSPRHAAVAQPAEQHVRTARGQRAGNDRRAEHPDPRLSGERLDLERQEEREQRKISDDTAGVGQRIE